MIFVVVHGMRIHLCIEQYNIYLVGTMLGSIKTKQYKSSFSKVSVIFLVPFNQIILFQKMRIIIKTQEISKTSGLYYKRMFYNIINNSICLVNEFVILLLAWYAIINLCIIKFESFG